LLTNSPLTSPTSKPPANPPITATGTGNSLTNSIALINPEKAMVEPTDRSIPAMMITSNSPNPATAIHEKLRIMLKMVLGLRNFSLAVAPKITINVIRIKITPNSWEETTLNDLRFSEGCRTSCVDDKFFAIQCL